MNIRKLQNFILQKLKHELSPKLTYHGVHHTINVLNSCRDYIRRMNLTPYDSRLLRTAALLHDTGFLWTYKNHEDKSMEYAKKILPKWNFSENEIEKINSIIRATKIPQKPTNILENIIGDSDLDYLGTAAFYTISETLYEESLAFGIIASREEWDILQIKFLQNHQYHTPFAQKFREPVKQKHLYELLKKTDG